MNEFLFLIALETYYADMASLCEDTPACRAFFCRDQRLAIERLQMMAHGYTSSELDVFNAQ